MNTTAITAHDIEAALYEPGSPGSFGRMDALLDFLPRTPLPVWLEAFGRIWTSCDGCWRHIETLGRIIPQGNVHWMMTPEAASYLQSLPDRVKVFRGADVGVNEIGMSWTTNLEVAMKFPTLNRYLAKHPVLVFGEVDRDSITAVFLDRGEAEVFVAHPEVVTITDRLPASGRRRPQQIEQKEKATLEAYMPAFKGDQ